MHVYASSWQRITGPAWLARHNIDDATYQKDFDQLPAQGYRVVCVSASSAQGYTRFASIWEKSAGPQWLARHGLSAAEFRTVNATNENQGMAPVSVTGYLDGGQPRFVALWQRGGSDGTALIDLTAAQYQAEFDARKARGLWPSWISIYATPAGERYAAVFGKFNGRGAHARHNISAADFATFADQQRAAGMRLVCAQGCEVGGREVYAGLWEAAPAEAWESRHGMTAEDHQTVFDLLSRVGYRPCFVGVGNVRTPVKLSRRAVIGSHADFRGTPGQTKEKLAGRGYAVTLSDVAATVVQAIDQHADISRPGDRMFVYFAGHGGDARSSIDDHDATRSGNHGIWLQNGMFLLRDVLAAFERAAGKGVDLTVLDGSCNGGETVLAAIGRPYAAISTVGIRAPSLTGIPNPAAEMLAQDPDAFGHWWSPTSTMASRLNRQFKSDRPDRVAQKILRNDDSEAARLALFWRSAYGLYGIGGKWDMMDWLRCHLARYVFKTEFDALSATDQEAFTLSADGFIAQLRTHALDLMPNMMSRLKSYLGNTTLNAVAATIYAQHDVQAWHHMGFDPEWWTPESNPFAEMQESTSRFRYWRKFFVYPNQYGGVAGFHKMLADILQVIADLDQVIEEMFDLFRRIERAAKLKSLVKVTLVDATEPRRWPDLLSEQRAYEKVHEKVYRQHVDLQVAAQVRKLPIARGGRSAAEFVRFEREFVSTTLAQSIADRIKPYGLDKSLEALVVDLHKVYERQHSLLVRGSTLLSVVEDAWFAAQRNGRTFACDASRF